jgi:hypothetical protein
VANAGELPPEGTQLLERATRDPRAEVRQQAAAALAAIRGGQ